MANPDFGCMLGGISIDAANNTIVLDEGGVLANAIVSSGTYYLRGDGAIGDLCLAVATAMTNAFAAGNAYVVDTRAAGGGAATWSRDAAAPTCAVRVSRSLGATSFRVRWLSSSFPAALLGFAAEKGVASAADEISTLPPSCVWVGTGHVEDSVPRVSWVVAEQDLANGDTDVILRSAKTRGRGMTLPMCSAARIYLERAGSLPAASLEAFLPTVLDGSPVELHRLQLQTSSSTALLNPSSSTMLGLYRCGESMARLLSDTRRSNTGIEQYDVDLQLVGFA